MRGYQCLLLVLILSLVAIGLWQFYLVTSDQTPATTADELWQAVGEHNHGRSNEILAQYPKFVRGTDQHGRTLFHHAVRQGRDDGQAQLIIGLLIELGGDVDAVDNDGQTPIHIAARLGLPEIAELLIVADADVEVRNSSGRTPLEVAEEFRLEQLADIGQSQRLKDRRVAVAKKLRARLESFSDSD